MPVTRHAGALLPLRRLLPATVRPRTISPITPKRVGALAPAGLLKGAGLFSVALVVALRGSACSRRLPAPDAPPLAGSLPYGVRTFLSRAF